MGYDQHQQPNSSGAAAAIAVAVLLVAIIGVLALAGAWLLLAGTSSVQSQAVASVQSQAVASEQLIVELNRAETETQRAVVHVQIKDGKVQVQQSSVAATPDPRLNIELNLDREGNISVDGEKFGHDELRTRLAKLKDETSNAFSVHIDADSDCLIKQIIPVLEVCEEVGDIDFRIVSSNAANPPLEESDAGT